VLRTWPLVGLFFSANIRLRWKLPTLVNTLAYYGTEFNTPVKKFYEVSPWIFIPSTGFSPEGVTFGVFQQSIFFRQDMKVKRFLKKSTTLFFFVLVSNIHQYLAVVLRLLLKWTQIKFFICLFIPRCNQTLNRARVSETKGINNRCKFYHPSLCYLLPEGLVSVSSFLHGDYWQLKRINIIVFLNSCLWHPSISCFSATTFNRINKNTIFITFYPYMYLSIEWSQVKYNQMYKNSCLLYQLSICYF